MYSLGSSTPLHVAAINPSNEGYVALALDLHSHLCDANGELSQAQYFEYDADTLAFVKGVKGYGDFSALVGSGPI